MRLTPKILIAAAALVTSIAWVTPAFAVSAPKGLWEFEDAGDLTAATIGADLALTNPNGTHAAVGGSGTIFDNGGAALGVGDYYTMTHGIAPNGGGGFVNQFTLLMDLSYPTESEGEWRALMQTSPTNSNDGDYFIHPADESWGVGDLGYTDGGAGTFFSSPDTWYRAVLTFDLGNAVKIYIDGTFVGDHNASSLDSRFSLDPTLLILADNDGEDNLMHISNLAIWEGALSEGDVASLGGAGREIPVPEPSSIALLLVALGGLNLARRRNVTHR